MRRKKILSSLVMLVLILMTLPATVTGTATIKLSDYWFSRGLGDSWTYGYTQPSGVPDFTVAITLVNEGVYSGKYRMGDYRNPDGTTYYNIVAFDNDFLYLYYDSKHNETFDPPAKIPITQELETMVPNPANPNTGLWYFKKLSKLTVPAGTYYDVLLKIDLDRNYGRNSANIYFGLPETIPYGVTHAEWSARHVGTLQDMDF
ncbi:MAG: hypothetical protein KKD99_05465, partial [Proteobacteria bacterium]|nr:hypothetical protein [Pseudomonadota bacterium]